MDQQAEWRPDPLGRHQLRYWNGSQWSEHVSDGGTTSTDASEWLASLPSPVTQASGRPGEQKLLDQAYADNPLLAKNGKPLGRDSIEWAARVGPTLHPDETVFGTFRGFEISYPGNVYKSATTVAVTDRQIIWEYHLIVGFTSKTVYEPNRIRLGEIIELRPRKNLLHISTIVSAFDFRCISFGVDLFHALVVKVADENQTATAREAAEQSAQGLALIINKIDEEIGRNISKGMDQFVILWTAADIAPLDLDTTSIEIIRHVQGDGHQVIAISNDSGASFASMTLKRR